MERLDIGRRRSQQQQAAFLRPGVRHAEPGHFLGMVGHAFILFVGGVVFLIEDDAAGVRHRQKQG